MKTHRHIKKAGLILSIPGILLTAMASQARSAVQQVNIEGTPRAIEQYMYFMRRPVVLTGNAEIKVEADRAIVSVRVITEADNLEGALNRNNAVRARLAYELRRAGFGEGTVHSERFSSTPRHGVFDEVQSYTTENTVRITVDSDKQFKEVSKLIDAIPELAYAGIAVEHSDEESLKENARKTALENLVRQKATCESGLDAHLALITFQVYEASSNREVESFRGRDQSYMTQSVLAEAAPAMHPEPAFKMPVSRGLGFGELVYAAMAVGHYEIKSGEDKFQ